jgi:hypothetical protein
MQDYKPIYYRLGFNDQSSCQNIGKLTLEARRSNIGEVGQTLNYQSSNAWYFSFHPVQTQHPSVAYTGSEQLIRTFESMLDDTTLPWKRFDLDALLQQID